MTHQEQNRMLAEWLEPNPEWRLHREADGLHTKSIRGAWWKGNGYVREPADFPNDEDASALLLEKLPIGSSLTRNNDGWSVIIWYKQLYFERNGAVRKKVIVQAALAQIKREK